jgi:hypothetical protein
LNETKTRPEIAGLDNRESAISGPQEERCRAMYQILIYPITANLWRWEIFSDRTLLRCGTGKSIVAAENELNKVVNAFREQGVF